MTTMWFYNGGEITASELQQSDRETQLEVMRNWFFSIYEDPVESTPYVSSEGGYIYIHGGPYEAIEEIEREFGGVVHEEIIHALASELDDISSVWTKHSGVDEDQFDELDESPIIDEPDDEPPIIDEPDDEPPIIDEPDDEPPIIDEPDDEPPIIDEPDDEPPIIDEPDEPFDESGQPPSHPAPPLLSDPLPSPANFEIRDGAVHKAPHSTPAPPGERRAKAESAWAALMELFADLAESSAGQNNPSIGRVLNRCRAAFGDEFQQLDVIMLGVHASRLDQIALRVDEVLMPGDAADLVAFNAQLGLFLGQFPEWSEYARGIADRFGSDEAEQKAVSDASDAVRAMRKDAPKLLAQDAADALTGLEEGATHETDVDGSIARRSYLRANRNLLLKLSSAVITPTEKGMKKGIERHFEAMTIGALSAASIWLIALATGLPAEFSWLTGIVAYLARIRGISSIEHTKNDNDAPPSK